MELSPYWETAIYAATERLYGTQRFITVMPILGQINPVYHNIQSKIHFNIVHPHASCIPIGLFPSGFNTSKLYAFCFNLFMLHVLPISLSLTWWVRFGEGFKFRSSLLCSFLHPRHFICPWSKDFLQHCVLKHSQSVPPLMSETKIHTHTNHR
jgi:hypothetical protein